MKFYQGLNPKVIWDPSNKKALIRFSRKGEFETDDENLIKILKKKGYLQAKDLGVLAAGGRVKHGGFEKLGINTDSQLPSGRSPVEDESTIHAKPGSQRQRSFANQSQFVDYAQKEIESEAKSTKRASKGTAKPTTRPRSKPVAGQTESKRIKRRPKK